MLGTAPSGSVQLQDYCVRPEKIGEPFYRPLLQGCPDVPKYPELPFPHSPVVKSCLPPIISGMPSRTFAPGTPSATLIGSWHRVPSIRKINQLSCQVIAFIGYRCPANSEYLGEHINANSDI